MTAGLKLSATSAETHSSKPNVEMRMGPRHGSAGPPGRSDQRPKHKETADDECQPGEQR